MDKDWHNKARYKAILQHRRRKEFAKELLRKHGPYCAICGKRLKKNEITIDHIIPLSKGGADIIQNMQLACLPCNSRKSDNLPSDF